MKSLILSLFFMQFLLLGIVEYQYQTIKKITYEKSEIKDRLNLDRIRLANALTSCEKWYGSENE